MSKLTLSDHGSLTNENSALSKLNSNYALVEAALEKTLSRDGTSPNSMEADFDMDSNRILNLPAAASQTEPVRLAEFEQAVLGDTVEALGLISGQHSSTDTAVARWSGITGARVEDSVVTLSDNGDMSGLRTLTSVHPHPTGGNGTAFSINAVTVGSSSVNFEAMDGGVFPDNTAFKINHYFGGSTLKGGRHALSVLAYQKLKANATSFPKEYAAIVGNVIAEDNEGGTISAQYANTGSIYGGNFYAKINPTATHFSAITGCEFDIEVTNTDPNEAPWYSSGISIVGASSHAQRGRMFDAAISVSYNPVGWKTGLLFSRSNGGWPFQNDSVMIGADNRSTVDGSTITCGAAYGIDFNTVSFVNYAIRTPGFTVDPTGNLIANALTSVTGTSNAYSGAIAFGTGSAQVLAATASSQLILNGAQYTDVRIRGTTLTIDGNTSIASGKKLTVGSATQGTYDVNIVNAANAGISLTGGAEWDIISLGSSGSSSVFGDSTTGSLGDLVFQKAGVSYVKIGSGGALNVGTSSIDGKFSVNANAVSPQVTAASTGGTGVSLAHFTGQDEKQAEVTVDGFGSTTNGQPVLTMRRARGTAATPTALQFSAGTGDAIFNIRAMGYHSGGGYTAAPVFRMRALAEENWVGSNSTTPTAVGTKFAIGLVAKTTALVRDTFTIWGSSGVSIQDGGTHTDPGSGSLHVTSNLGVGTTVNSTYLIDSGNGTGQKYFRINGGNSTAQGAGIFFAANGTNTGYVGNYSAYAGGTDFSMAVIATNDVKFVAGSSTLTLTSTGSFITGNAAALATNATDGFVYMPTCAGTPTGVPTAVTGRVAWAYDTTNNKIYVYNGAWKATAALT